MHARRVATIELVRRNRMPTDLYMKSVLTVIAACLLALVLRSYNAVPQLYAAGSSSQVLDVNIAEIDGHDFGFSQVNSLRPTLPVSID